jgi:hypothetical protein
LVGGQSLSISGGCLTAGGLRSGVNVNGASNVNGGGGAGVFLTQSQTAKNGGAGGNGIVIVDCFV